MLEMSPLYNEENDEEEEEKKDEEFDRLLVPSGGGEEPSLSLSSEAQKSAHASHEEEALRPHQQHHDSVVGVSFSLQLVAAVVLVLFVASQATLFRCCRVSVHNREKMMQRQIVRREQQDPNYRIGNSTVVPILRKYSLNIKSAAIWSSTSNSASQIGTVYQGDDIIVEEQLSATSKFDREPLLRLLRPYLGYVEQRQRRKPLMHGNNKNEMVYPQIFEPLPHQNQPRTGEFTTNSMCPLLYSAWIEKKSSRTMYASTTLVVAQQFWNGMQVCLLLLMILVHFKCSTDVLVARCSNNPLQLPSANRNSASILSSNDNDNNDNDDTKNKEARMRTWRMLPLALLPLMMYLVHPDGYFPMILVSLLAVVLLVRAFFSILQLEPNNYAPHDNVKQEQMNARPLWDKLQFFAIQSAQFVSKLVASKSFQLWAVRCLGLITVCLLPFSSYVSSPGGHCFAFLTAVWITLAFVSPRCNLRLSLGNTQSIEREAIRNNAHSMTPPYTICFEETLGFLCTLGSSLYNFAGHTYVWPHWKEQFHKIDSYMGWPKSGDLTWEENWTIWGIFAERSVLPPFVPRGNGGSTMGAQQFWIVWSVLPFLYCCYYGCMIILSQKTPSIISRWFQRLACVFGILHFLFGTDVVHYRYGRGYRNPHSELFHWTEKW